MLITILMMASASDLVYSKIPNRLIALGLGYAVFTTLLSGKAELVSDRVIGTFLPIVALLWLLRFELLGAGDMKLFSVVGAFLGVRAVLFSIGISFSVGALIGGIKMIRTGMWRTFPYGKVSIRFALPVLIGTIVCMALGA